MLELKSRISIYKDRDKEGSKFQKKLAEDKANAMNNWKTTKPKKGGNDEYDDED